MSGQELSDLQNELAMIWVVDGPAAVHQRLLETDPTLTTALLMANIGARATAV